jgi:hypothetical protein
MGQKIAVAIVHGVGKTEPGFADGMMKALRRRFADEGASTDDLVMRPVHWSPVLQSLEDELAQRLKRSGSLGYGRLRDFMMSFAGDAIAYQPGARERVIYDRVHAVMAESLRALAAEAGGTAPLAVIAHSLGTIIASNYFYDLQVRAEKNLLSEPVLAAKGDTPLENGETFSLLYTLGSPLAVWSLRYKDFGAPLVVPSTGLARHWPGITGEWVNYYDKNDVIGYPLKSINPAYDAAVKADQPVSVGNFFTTLTPLCHTQYWTDRSVTSPIAQALAGLWRQANTARG